MLHAAAALLFGALWLALDFALAWLLFEFEHAIAQLQQRLVWRAVFGVFVYTALTLGFAGVLHSRRAQASALAAAQAESALVRAELAAISGKLNQFMQRLAALVPSPGLHLIRFHGVLAPNAKLRALVVSQEPEPPAPAAECEATCAHHRPARLSWAKLHKRVFEIDIEHRPNCGGELKIIAAILEQPVIEKILTHPGMQARAPPCAPARGS